MSKQKILVIEDDEDIQELLKFNLNKEGFQVKCVSNGEQGLKYAKTDIPDLIILDLMLPGIDGLDVCKALKATEETSQIPIIMLTAKGEESDIVVGLELGADDYVTKPFSVSVLLARIKALLRRHKEPFFKKADMTTVVKIKNMVIHPGRREVLVDNKPIKLTNTEFKTLHLLARHPGWVFTRQQIIDAVRGEGIVITDRAIDVQIVGLRRKLGKAGDYIETIWGVGYRFKD